VKDEMCKIWRRKKEVETEFLLKTRREEGFPGISRLRQVESTNILLWDVAYDDADWSQLV
jgi:hypothetical protein